jgi:hypothetical protein
MLRRGGEPGPVLEVDFEALAARADKIPDEADAVLRLFDGERAVLDVVEACDYDDEAVLDVILRLHDEGLLREAESAAPERAILTLVDAREPSPEASIHADLAPSSDEIDGIDETDESDEIDAMNAMNEPVPARRGRKPLAVAGAIFASLALACVVWLGARERSSSASVRRAPAPAPAPIVAAGPPAPAVEPTPEDPATAADYESLLRDARRLTAHDHSAAAARIYRRALALRPNSVEALAGLATALFDGDDLRAAESYADRALAIDRGYAPAHLIKGAIAQHLKHAEARAEYERYLALAPAGEYAEEVRSVLRRLR